MSKTRIMLVEDDELFARSIKETLFAFGYEITAIVSSGELAIPAALANPPELVLMDITLAGEIDGIAAAAQIRANQDLPILYLTALADMALLDRVKATEPFGYLLKPFQEQELRIALDMALYRHKLETDLREANRRLAQEIIAHQQTEELLHWRVQEFQALAENAPDIIARFDRALRCVYVNPAIAQATGRPAQAYIENTYPELGLPAELCADWQVECLNIFATGQEKVLEFEVAAPAGRKWYQARLVPEFAIDGSVRFILALSRDLTDLKQTQEALQQHRDHLEDLVNKRTLELTQANARLQQEINERKRAEAALRESEQRYRALFESSPEGILLTAPDGSVFAANPAACQMFGRTEQDIQQVGRNGLLDPYDPRLAAFLEERRRTGKARGELTGLRKDGPPFPVEISSAIFEISHGIQHTSLSLRDITARKQGEATLRASEQQYRLLVEHVADGIGIIQAEQLVFVNDALAAMLGDIAAHLIGETPIDLFHGVPKAQFERLYAQLEKRIAAPQWQVLEFIVTGQGKEVWMEGRHSTIVWEGNPAILIAMRDISERKRREQEMKQEGEHLRQENIRLRSMMHDRYKFGEIIGKSPAMQEVYELILKAAATDANVIIYGESGTGKDLIAQTIHSLSPRREKAFIPVNCGSIPEALFESAFFGHRKGAFTGALKDTPGFFDAAHQGTLFLDEIGELPLTMQVKLLRAIEGKGYTPVGDQTIKYADVRLLAATNRNLKEHVKQGLMREDFFYRINIITMTVPPLRDRREDIPLLVEHFLKQYSKPDTRPVLPGRILEVLDHYNWPGNIRQLQNVLQRYLTLQRLDLDDSLHDLSAAERELASGAELASNGLGFNEAVQQFEKRLIVNMLERNHWHRTKTATMLGIPRRSLLRKMQQYGLQ